MEDKIAISVDEETLEVARNRWYKGGRGIVASHSFDYYLEQFQSHKTLEEIAQASNVTRQNVCRIYNTYFFEIFGGNGRHRQRQISLAKRTKDVGKNYLSKEKKELRRVARMAGNRGLVVEAVPCLYNGEPRGRANAQILKIAGKTCRIHRLTNTQQTNPRSKKVYIHATLGVSTLHETDFSIFVCRTKNMGQSIFVIPNWLLLERIGNGDQHGTRQFYLPTRKRRLRNGRQPIINFWPYKNAWHLLVERQ